MARDYGSAFMKGANANNYAANSTNCFDRLLNFWFYQVPLLPWRYYYGTFDDSLFNTTRTWGNATNAAMVCFDVAENLSIFTANKVQLFPDFTSMLMAFFQNLLGSITTLINIYKNISTAITNNNLTPIFSELGKAFKILIDFQPIDFAGIE
jgi:hypothetical protein